MKKRKMISPCYKSTEEPDYGDFSEDKNYQKKEPKS